MAREHGIGRLLQESSSNVHVRRRPLLGRHEGSCTAVDLLTTAAPASEGAIDAAVSWLLAMFFVVKHQGDRQLRAAGEGVAARVSKEIIDELLCQKVAVHDTTTAVGAFMSAVSGRGGHSARCNQGAPRAALEACHHMCPSLSPYAPRERAEGSRQHGQRSLARAVARALARALVSHVPSGFRRAVGGRPALIGVRRLCYTEKDENVKYI